MYTPRLLKITAANILIFIIKKQTVIKHSKTNINAERKSKVDDNTARMQSIKQLGV